MKKKLQELKEYAFKVRNSKPQAFNEALNKKIDELTKDDNIRTLITLLIGSAFGVTLLLLIDKLN